MVPSIAVMPREGSCALASLWQNEKGPGAGLLALGRPEEFRFETDQGFSHLAALLIALASSAG